MNMESILLVGGFYHLAGAVFHLMFWKLFHWNKELATLNALNRAVMQILNLCLTFVFIMFAYLSIFYRAELLSTGLGRAVLLLISVFWILRAVEQIVFFGLKSRLSIGMFLIFLTGAFLYSFPFLL